MNYKIFLTTVLFIVVSLTQLIPAQLNAQDVEWTSIEHAQELSSEDNKPLFVFVEAEWCGTCKQMLANVFPEEKVKRTLNENYHPVSIDLDSEQKIIFNGEEMTEREFARSQKISATPTMLFIDNNGEELGRQLGFMDADEITKLMIYVISDQFNEISFEEFKSGG